MSHVPPDMFNTKGPTLRHLVASSTTWERTVVPIGAAARWALGILTAGALVVVAAQLTVVPKLATIQEPELFLFGWPWCRALLAPTYQLLPAHIAVAVVCCALAVLTGGFAHAGRRLQIALGVVCVLGVAALALPVAIVIIAAANVAAWIALTVAAIGLGLALLVGALSGLDA